MATLQERLDGMRAQLRARLDPRSKAIMDRATATLQASGIMDRVPRSGHAVPPFELVDTNGALVSSDRLLERGPLIISFYRGLW